MAEQKHEKRQEVPVCLSETAETHSNTDLQLRAQTLTHTWSDLVNMEKHLLLILIMISGTIWLFIFITVVIMG